MTPSLPDWLTPLPDAEQMRATDSWAIEERGIASLDLMERAGAGVVDVGEAIAPDGPVAIVCGSGNNGGDGYVAARIWREHGREVRVLAVADPSSGDAQASARRLPGAAPEQFDAGALQGAALIVDALLGTGFSGAPREPVAAAIEAINASGAPVVAVDVPSGVDASRGEVAGVAVRARATATFDHAKPGLWIEPGKSHAGTVHTIDIGIPRGAPAEPAAGLIEPAVVAELPSRRAVSTKFDSGRVAIAGGSRGLTGAVCLAAHAAARAGAGYVTAFVPASLEAIFEAKLTEQMTRALPDSGGSLKASGAATVAADVSAGALILGPGLGRRAAPFARKLALAARTPLLLDADGLNAHAGLLPALARRESPTILTPHAGELARLLGSDSKAIAAARLASALEAARISGAIVVLKGDDTLVARPDGVVAISRGAAPGLATAGTGDVLSGVIGALLAAGAEPFAAACAGVWIHCEAGRLAADRAGHVTAVVAGDVIERLGQARARADSL